MLWDPKGCPLTNACCAEIAATYTLLVEGALLFSSRDCRKHNTSGTEHCSGITPHWVHHSVKSFHLQAYIFLVEGALEFRIVFFTFISQAPNSNSGSSAAKHRAVVCLDLDAKSIPATAGEDPVSWEDSRVPRWEVCITMGTMVSPANLVPLRAPCSVLSVSCGELAELGELEKRHKVVDLAKCVLVHPDLKGWTFLSMRTTESSVLTPPKRRYPHLLCQIDAKSSELPPD